MFPDIILNGPLNFIELTNKKQKLYLFMDNHKNITKQKKCDDYEAKDIDKYLYKILSETSSQSDTIDFFLEINPTDINKDYKYYSNDNYILEIRKMFRKIYKEQEIKNKFNIRLHYMDVRDYSFYNEIIVACLDLVNEVDQYKLTRVDYIIGELEFILDKLSFINECIKRVKNGEIHIETMENMKNIDLVNFKFINKSNKKENTNSISKSLEELSPEQKKNMGIIVLLYKILLNYSNEQDRKINNTVFNENYIKIANEAIEQISELIKYIDSVDQILDNQYKNENLNIRKIVINEKKKLYYNIIHYGIIDSEYTEYTRYILDKLVKIELMILNLGTVFMDCFFLRRLVEKKDIIKKGIIYTGGYHTITYIWFLIKYYNFEITNYYYINMDKLKSDSKNISEINKKIKKIVDSSLNPDNLLEIFLPAKFNQCIKIKSL